MSAEDVTMTKHSIQRTKDRVCLSKKIAKKNALKALDFGVTHAEAKNGLKRYLDYLYLTYGRGNNVRVYHHYVYIFQGKTLITILPLPNKFCKLADKIQKQKDTEQKIIQKEDSGG